ncbi:MAG: hypothetical protein ACFB6S_07670 [Geminicoccaceae bacterium]
MKTPAKNDVFDELAEEDRAEEAFTNRLMMRLTRFLGLTTGVGVIAWGAWSLLVTIGMTFYERSGLSEAEILVEDAFNQGLLQSAMLIAIGAVILELRRINETIARRADHDG